MLVVARRAPTTIATLRLLVARSQRRTHKMPFILRSDEELIAEAQRALAALGVEVVLDPSSGSAPEFWARQPEILGAAQAAILTSREAAAWIAAQTGRAERNAGVLVAALRRQPREYLACALDRNRDVDVRRRVTVWWRTLAVNPPGVQRVCGRCSAAIPSSRTFEPCDQCMGEVCRPCDAHITIGPGCHRWGARRPARAAVLRGVRAFGPGAASKTFNCVDHCVFKCPSCESWHLSARDDWGVPWDMPRPAPTRREGAAATAPPSASALPQRMALAVGPDGWLRLPPQHQRMHPVDVLVDGVLAALDGCVRIFPYVSFGVAQNPHVLEFTSVPLRDGDVTFSQGGGVDGARRRLKRSVEELMRVVVQGPEAVPARVKQMSSGFVGALAEVWIQTQRLVARVHSTADAPVAEVSLFVVRKREPPSESSSSPTDAHEWELVQAAPGWLDRSGYFPFKRVQVAYLEPRRFALPAAFEELLRDAQARVRPGRPVTKTVGFWRDVDGSVPGHPADPTASRPFLSVQVDAEGRVLDEGKAELPRVVDSMLRQSRMAGARLYVDCQDKEVTERLMGKPLPQRSPRLEEMIGWMAGLDVEALEREAAARGEGDQPCLMCGVVCRVVWRLGPHAESFELLSHEASHEVQWVPQLMLRKAAGRA